MTWPTIPLPCELLWVNGRVRTVRAGTAARLGLRPTRWTLRAWWRAWRVHHRRVSA